MLAILVSFGKSTTAVIFQVGALCWGHGETSRIIRWWNWLPRRRHADDAQLFCFFLILYITFFFPSEFSFPDTQRDKYSTERKYSISPSLRCTSLVQEEKQSAKRKKNSTPPSQNCRDSSEQVRTQVRPGRLNPKRLSSAAPPLLCRQVRKRSALRHYIPSATSLDSTWAKNRSSHYRDTHRPPLYPPRRLSLADSDLEPSVNTVTNQSARGKDSHMVDPLSARLCIHKSELRRLRLKKKKKLRYIYRWKSQTARSPPPPSRILITNWKKKDSSTKRCLHREWVNACMESEWKAWFMRTCIY